MAINKARIREIIEKFEGNKAAPYYDGKGLITIGIGVGYKTPYEVCFSEMSRRLAS